jgi:hypothetical protein
VISGRFGTLFTASQRGFTLALAVALIAACTGRQPVKDESAAPLPESEGPAHSDPIVRKAARRLAALGLHPDVSQLSVETRSLEEALEDVQANAPADLRRDYFAGILCLGEVFKGAQMSVIDPETMRALAFQGYVSKIAAYYEPSRKAMVFLDTDEAKLRPPDDVVVHELMHLRQDLMGIPLRGPVSSSTDQLRT